MYENESVNSTVGSNSSTNSSAKRSTSVTHQNITSIGPNRLQIKIPEGSVTESEAGGFKSFTTRNAETGESF